jgi:ATP-dependent DNA helicase PIF1
MLLKNLAFGKGLVNGSCGYVSALSKDSIEVDFDNGVHYFMDREDTELKQGRTVKIRRKQYPLCLAWAISQHKAQGSTFDTCYVDCEDIFTNGQAYVALSRVRSLDGLYLTNFDSEKIYADGAVVDFYEKL